MRALAIVLTAVAVSAPAATATAAPRFVAVDVKVSAAHRTVRLTTIVEDSAAQVLDRAYRTTLYYRCGSATTWQIAVRSRRTSASVSLAFRYAASLSGQRCAFRAKVARLDTGRRAISATIRRRL